MGKNSPDKQYVENAGYMGGKGKSIKKRESFSNQPQTKQILNNTGSLLLNFIKEFHSNFMVLDELRLTKKKLKGMQIHKLNLILKTSILSLLQGMVRVRKWAGWSQVVFQQGQTKYTPFLTQFFLFLSFYYFKERKSHQYL